MNINKYLSLLISIICIIQWNILCFGSSFLAPPGLTVSPEQFSFEDTWSHMPYIPPLFLDDLKPIFEDNITSFLNDEIRNILYRAQVSKLQLIHIVNTIEDFDKETTISQILKNQSFDWSVFKVFSYHDGIGKGLWTWKKDALKYEKMRYDLNIEFEGRILNAHDTNELIKHTSAFIEKNLNASRELRLFGTFFFDFLCVLFGIDAVTVDTTPVEIVIKNPKSIKSIQQPTNMKKEEFIKYLKNNDLDRYQALRNTFTSEIIEVLINDPVLRPVFLHVLPNHALGPMQIIDSDALDTLGGEDLIVQHSAFLVGSPAVAEEVVKRGDKIIIGVTDRKSEDTLIEDFTIANGRQCYFPLPDGTWLGVKGAGQFYGEVDQPFYPLYSLAGQPVFHRYEGLASEKEAKKAWIASDKLKKANEWFWFTRFLGYRRLYELPDGKGSLMSTKNLQNTDGTRYNPVLIFSRVLHPHRLVKFPQVLKTDPGLSKLKKKVPFDLIAIARVLGRAEAIKQNLGLYKKTIHAQDFTFVGEETDLEELCDYETFMDFTEQYFKRHHMPDNIRLPLLKLLTIYRLNIFGLMTKITTINLIGQTTDNFKQTSIFFPSKVNVLKSLLSSYLNNLNDEWLTLWVTPPHEISPLKVLGETCKVRQRLSWFSSNYTKNMADAELSHLNDEMVNMIRIWAEEAKQTLTIGISTDKKAQIHSIVKSK